MRHNNRFAAEGTLAKRSVRFYAFPFPVGVPEG